MEDDNLYMYFLVLEGFLYIYLLKLLFVENDRVGGGFWRRGGETPLAVKWEERIIEIREGSWSYIAGSIGKIPGMLSDF